MMQVSKSSTAAIVVILGLVAFAADSQSETQVQTSAGNAVVSLTDHLAINGVKRGMQAFSFQDPDGIRRVVFTHVAAAGDIPLRPPRMFTMLPSCSTTENKFSISVEDYDAHPHVIHVFDCVGGSLADSVWFMAAGGMPRLVWSRT